MSVETLPSSRPERRDPPHGAAASNGPAEGPAHRHGQDHGQDHGHVPGNRGRRDARRVAIGPSVLRMSLGARLVLAAALLAPLWIAVLLVMG